jgi:hypothetical protein
MEEYSAAPRPLDSIFVLDGNFVTHTFKDLRLEHPPSISKIKKWVESRHQAEFQNQVFYMNTGVEEEMVKHLKRSRVSLRFKSNLMSYAPSFRFKFQNCKPRGRISIARAVILIKRV